MKIRTGIVFGGPSREREVSFAGGRTVYDNFDKVVFEPVPVFVDSFRNFWLLDWQFIYKGSIRDFYPPADALPESEMSFQLYAESLGDLDSAKQQKLLAHAGTLIQPYELEKHIDFAFLCLHGPFGEDGRIQGLFEFFGIPYSGSGILPSVIGIDKVIQRGLMEDAGFPVPDWFSVNRKRWRDNPGEVYTEALNEVKFPLVVKAAIQGSSIGVTIVQNEDEAEFTAAMERAFFIYRIKGAEWNALDNHGKLYRVR